MRSVCFNHSAKTSPQGCENISSKQVLLFCMFATALFQRLSGRFGFRAQVVSQSNCAMQRSICFARTMIGNVRYAHSAYVHAVLYPQMSRFSSVCLTIMNKPTGSLKLKKLPTSYAKNTAAAVLFSARQYQHGKLLSCRKENSIRFAELSKLQAIKKKR